MIIMGPWRLFTLPTECLSRYTAGDYSNGVEVSIGNHVPDHTQNITEFFCDIGFRGLVEIGVEEVRESNEAIEEVTEAQMEEKDNRIELEH